MVQEVLDVADYIKTQFGDFVDRSTVDRSWLDSLFERYTPEGLYEGGDLVLMITGSYPGSIRFTGPSPSRMPTPGKIRGNRYTVQKRFYIMSEETDLFVKALTRSKAGAFAQADVETMDRLADEFVRYMERIDCGSGDGVATYAITDVSGVTAANWTFTVPAADAVFYYQGMQMQFLTTVSGDANLNLRNSTMYDVPSPAGFYTCKSVEPNTTTAGADSATLARITIYEASPGSNSPANGAVCVFADAVAIGAHTAGTNAGREPRGLEGICNNDGDTLQADTDLTWTTDGTFQGLSVTTAPYWKAITMSAASSRLLEPVLRKHADLMNAHSPGGGAANIDLYLTSMKSARFYEESLTAEKRITIEGGRQVADAQGGFSSSHAKDNEPESPKFGKVPIHSHRFKREGSTLAICKKHLKRAQLLGTTWLEKHLNFSSRPAEGREAIGILENFTGIRACHGRIENEATV